MKCDTAQRVLSDRVDGPVATAVDAQVDEHLADCPACTAFQGQLAVLRRQLRVAAVEPPPDIAGAVRQRLETEPATGRRAHVRTDWLRAAAVFVVAFGLGAAAVGLGGPGQVAAVELDQLVRTGQHRVQSLQADVAVTERGWHPDVPTRAYVGTLAYDAPERLTLALQDQSTYPHDGWRANDLTIVIDDAVAWSRARVGCPMAALPDCMSTSPRTNVVTGREPFDPTESVPLDLVVAVASFGSATTAAATTPTTVDARRAVEVTVPVSQLQPMLDGVLDVGTWRQLHPTDMATVALDAQYGIPLQVEVTVGSSTTRDRWAAAQGYDETPGDLVWSWTLANVEVNTPLAAPPPTPPDDVDVTVDRGFEAGGEDVVGMVADLPADLSLHRVGTVGDLAVASWSDGRAWLRIRVHRTWQRPQLFGRRGGELVRRVELPPGGVAYVAEGGTEVFLHGTEVDVAIAGSMTPEQLRDIAAQVDVRGVAVPRDWSEASATTLAQARQALPGLLVPPPLGTFSGPGVRVADTGVTLSFSGNGDRGFVLAQTPGAVLTPPLDDVVLGVAVRGFDGRYTPRTGALEWVEQGRTITLRSATLPLPELLALAERLERSS